MEENAVTLVQGKLVSQKGEIMGTGRKGKVCLRLAGRGARGFPGVSDSKKVKVLVAQSCPALCNPMDCSPPGSSVHGILQARRLEWVAMPFSRGSSLPRDRTQGLNPGLSHCRQILERGPGGLQSKGSQRVGHNWVTKTFAFQEVFARKGSPQSDNILKEATKDCSTKLPSCLWL